MMKKYPAIAQVLQTFFNAEDGLSEDVAIRLYVGSVPSGPKIDVVKQELRQAFKDNKLSWKEMLLNDEYEVYDAVSEDEAKQFALRILWAPLQEAGLLTASP